MQEAFSIAQWLSDLDPWKAVAFLAVGALIWISRRYLALLETGREQEIESRLVVSAALDRAAEQIKDCKDVIRALTLDRNA